MLHLQAELLDVVRQYRGMSRRAGVYDALLDRLRAGQYATEQEAIQIKRAERLRLDEAIERDELTAPYIRQQHLWADGEESIGPII
jgi:hypothetical protein